MWSRLFSKKDTPQIEQLNKELENLLKKSNSEFITVVGINGKIKGLDIMTVASNKQSMFGAKQIKRFAAKAAEFFLRFKMLEFMPPEVESPVKGIRFYYNKEMSFFIVPVTTSFVLLTYNSIGIRVVNNINKVREILVNLEQGGDEE